MGMSHIRIAVVAAAIVTSCLVGAVFVLNGSIRQQPVQLTAGGGTSAAPVQPSASPSSSPATSPGSVPDAPPAAVFACGARSLSNPQGPATAFVSTIRTGSHPGYDRLVVEFTGAAPRLITLKPQATTTFSNSPKGDSVSLAGSAGLHMVIQGADAHTSYSGPFSFRPNGAGLVEVRRIEDFEGYVGFGLGLAKSSCYRAFMLTSPSRLVIDVQVV
jgi:hypothetical protein